MRNMENWEISPDIKFDLWHGLSSYLSVKYGQAIAKAIETDISSAIKSSVAQKETKEKKTRFGNGRKTWKDIH